MVEDEAPSGTGTRGFGPHWKGHFFLFERSPAPSFDSSAGLALLLIFVLLEGVLGPRLSLFHWLGLPLPPPWVRVPLLLSLALLLVRTLAALPLAQIGLRPWREWSRTEKSYFLQVLVIANAVFLTLFAAPLRILLAPPSTLWGLATVVFPSFVWGFHQEVVYRGILQTELVRRWGALAGIVVANLLYTFGPLHFYHFARGASALPMFVAIFAIGLFFSVLFHRSRNLWMVAVFHGIGNAYLLGSLG